MITQVTPLNNLLQRTAATPLGQLVVWCRGPDWLATEFAFARRCR